MAASVYSQTSSSNPYSFDQALGIMNSWYAPQYALLQSQQSSAAGQNAAANRGYGINAQQTNADFEHAMRAYDIDAQNLQYKEGALNRQQGVLDAGWGVNQGQHSLALNEIERQRQAQQMQHEKAYAQQLSEQIAGGGVLAQGFRNDRATDRALQANAQRGFANAVTRQDYEQQLLAQQYYNARGNIADQRAFLGSDLLALGNQKDAARVNRDLALAQNAANQAGTNAGYAGQTANNAYQQGQLGIGAAQGAFNSGATPVPAGGNSFTNKYTPQQIQQGITTLQNNLSNPVAIQNIGNKNNPLGVRDDTWNQMIMLAVFQNNGIQDANSLRNLANIINLVKMAQAQNNSTTAPRIGSTPGRFLQ